MVEENESRIVEPLLGVQYKADGTRTDSAEGPEVLARLESIAEGWRLLNATGDRSRLVLLGILPASEF